MNVIKKNKSDILKAVIRTFRCKPHKIKNNSHHWVKRKQNREVDNDVKKFTLHGTVCGLPILLPQ